MIVAVYVDDVLIATESDKTMQDIKSKLMQKFQVKDLGELRSFLGVQVNQSADGIWIGQPGYAARVLERYCMTDCNSVATPVDVSVKLQKECGGDEVDKELYQIGCWISVVLVWVDSSRHCLCSQQCSKVYIMSLKRALDSSEKELCATLRARYIMVLDTQGITVILLDIQMQAGLEILMIGDLCQDTALCLTDLPELGAAKSRPQCLSLQRKQSMWRYLQLLKS